MLKIFARIKKEPQIIKFKNNHDVFAELGQDFNIEMNIVMTFGECVQGVIGSEYKLDALFLGPNYEKALKLLKYISKRENCLIMDDYLFKNLSLEMKQHCRTIDCVKFDDKE
jgi:hypothetical protein